MVHGIFKEDGDIYCVESFRERLLPDSPHELVKELHDLLPGDGKSRIREQVASA